MSFSDGQLIGYSAPSVSHGFRSHETP